MKTTNKYAAKVSQPASAPVREVRTADPTPVAPCSRDIVLMRIRQILKSAQEV